MTIEHWIDLTCHPSIRADTVRAIQVRVRRSAAAELHLTFRLDGDIPRIRIPSPAAPRIGTELWRHTCFEAFIALENQTSYHEFNFAPSGEWCVYALSSYRNGSPIVRLDSLSAIHSRASLRIGLSAVIETTEGYSYWALRHPTAKPDFHNAAGFALLLEPPVSE